MKSQILGHSNEFPNASLEKESIKRLARLISGQLDWNELPDGDQITMVQLSRQHLVFPLLYRALEKCDSNESSTILQRLHLEILRHKARFLLLAKTTREVNQTLKNAEIPALWFKGIALAYTLYDEPWLRSMADLDVLVPHDQSILALDELIQVGFSNKLRQSVGIQLAEVQAHMASDHHFILLPETKDIILELHYDFAIRHVSHQDLTMLDWFWTHSRIVQTQLGDLLVLDNESELLLVSMHDLVQHQLPTNHKLVPGRFKLYRKHDIHLLVSQDSLDWDLVFRQAKAFEWLDTVWASITQTHEYFGTPANFEILERELQTQYHITYQNIHHNFRSFRKYNRSWRFFLQLPVPEKVTFLRKRVFFISQSEMRKLYHLDATQRVWPYYLWRIIHHTGSIFHLMFALILFYVEKAIKRCKR